MNVARAALLLFVCLLTLKIDAQHISDFNSLSPAKQDENLHIPAEYSFQYIIQHRDPLTDGKEQPNRNDFTAYVPIEGSSTKGYILINSETTPGGVTVIDVELDETRGKWNFLSSGLVDFSCINGTDRNCSGAITPWNTVITCEEKTIGDLNADGYNDIGWAIEIDPATRKVIDHEGGMPEGDKLWAMGNFRHENAVVHKNRRTVYQGVDDKIGYLYKFVSDQPEVLSSGKLYVYKGPKEGNGEWIELNNSTPEEQNSVLAQSANVGATVFDGIEDVEIGSKDNMVYLAVKNEGKVYRLTDDDPISGTTVSNFSTYVGGMSYDIGNGSVVPWTTGNDNLAFDDRGNLWVTQDSDNCYVWLVEDGHTQAVPKVKIFALSPAGSEPTGITFTPDYKYMFISFQHPNASNSATSQLDAFCHPTTFGKDLSIIISRSENLNYNAALFDPCGEDENIAIYPNPADNKLIIATQESSHITQIQMLNVVGKEIAISTSGDHPNIEVSTQQLKEGTYFLRMQINNDKWVVKQVAITH